MLCQPIRYVLPKSAFLLEVYYDKNGDFKEQPKWDTDGNGKLSRSEAAAVVYISIDDSRIRSLSGIEHFTGLEYLICIDSGLTELNIPKNTNLEVLVCYYNDIAELDVTKNSKLFYLDCDGNKLTELDVSKNPELELLDCRDNNLTRLDVTNNTKLIVLHCQKNKLSQLNVTKNTNLHYLECRDNRMRDLDASNMAFDSEGNYTLYCGNQTTDRSTTQILALTLREDMKSHWETGLKSHRFNTNVQLVQ